MPNPIKPSTWKAIIPAATGGLCERLSKLFQSNQVAYQNHAYKYNEAGGITNEYAADFCATGCTGGGGGPPNPNMPAPQNVMATDDAHSDKIVITWDTVTPPTGIAAVTEYKIYRSLATNVDPALAELIATVSAPTTTYDDMVDADLIAGTNYIYWVKATNGSDESAYSTPNTGRAASSSGSMDAVADLKATYGFGNSSTGVGPSGDAIALVWTPPAGATKYDVYRGTTGVFADATKIYSDVSPYTTTAISHPTNNPTFWDNVGELLLYDVPPSTTTSYFYWVVAKKSSPPAESTESNVAQGQVMPDAIYNMSSDILSSTNLSSTVPALATKVWVVFRGEAGSGAGGANPHGGGGGGGSATIVEALTVAPSDLIELVETGATPGNAPSATDGDDSNNSSLNINAAPAGISATGGTGGQYSASGGGVGGTGGIGAGGAPVVIHDGRDGLPSVGSNGGRSGYPFGFRRIPQADALGSFNGDGNAGGFPGSGAKAIPINPTLSVGGKGSRGKVYLHYGT